MRVWEMAIGEGGSRPIIIDVDGDGFMTLTTIDDSVPMIDKTIIEESET